MVEYFEPKVKDSLRLSDFWSTLFDLVLPIWPSRVTLPSHPTYPLGDVWPCKSLSKSLDQAGKERKEGDDFVPFHKLTQWLCYSLVDAIESETGWKVDKGLGQTGLPEVSTKQSFACLCRADNLRLFFFQYRNGGLFIDLGAFIIKPESLGGNAYPNGKDKPPVLEPSHPAVIEWRALTVISLYVSIQHLSHVPVMMS